MAVYIGDLGKAGQPFFLFGLEIHFPATHIFNPVSSAKHLPVCTGCEIQALESQAPTIAFLSTNYSPLATTTSTSTEHGQSSEICKVILCIRESSFGSDPSRHRRLETGLDQSLNRELKSCESQLKRDESSDICETAGGVAYSRLKDIHSEKPDKRFAKYTTSTPKEVHEYRRHQSEAGRCHNCRKSNRVCRRGVRLNFIDIQNVAPPHVVARPHGAKVTFRDDSRLIASEYVGGFERYPPIQPESPAEEQRLLHHSFEAMGSDDLTSLFQSVAHSFDPLDFDVPHPGNADFGTDVWQQSQLVPGDELLPHGTSNFARKLAKNEGSHSFITDPERMLLFRAFVEHVAPRMDAVDEMEHFTHILPCYALDEPMLLKAFLACGARNLSLVDSSYGEETAMQLYDEATQDLLNCIHDSNRDSVLCAATALALGFFETMSPLSSHRRAHIAGSRALIRECGWTSKTPGLGGACFKISISAELLNCIRYNWSLSWDPNTWGIDMNMDHCHAPSESSEDAWSYRIFYICAKVVIFQASFRSQYLSNNATGATQLNDQFQEWSLYNNWCENWEKSAPRSMAPLGYLQSWQTNSKSAFPEIMIHKRSAIVARLFFHTTRILLSKSNPIQSEFDGDMRDMQRNHAHEMCGLIACIKDRSLSDILLRCLAIAAECLETRSAQEEVLGIFDIIAKTTTSNVESVKNDLRQIWSWVDAHPHTVTPAQMHNHYYELDPSLAISEDSGSPSRLSNPLITAGDFSMENHPYQGYYVPPHHHHALDQYHYGAYLI
ncbi:hypothetical protein PENANT_c011G09810 [Penicillium antarcticum]|uniref:Transcription factor domain-containing protein n=1 Tax=Penicillium antarcticum TaxID=416450 RepID=A0A1V6Q6V2_9EURO|nr:hypothetical protein PENANT_c011G09810 [Penicillium antarcticum]